jgi:hypothetical protein
MKAPITDLEAKAQSIEALADGGFLSFSTIGLVLSMTLSAWAGAREACGGPAQRDLMRLDG